MGSRLFCSIKRMKEAATDGGVSVRMRDKTSRYWRRRHEKFAPIFGWVALSGRATGALKALDPAMVAGSNPAPSANMPIKPENKSRYPKNWKEIRASILERAHNCCEFCGIENYAIRENGSRVVLTIAHLDHTPENCDPSNLRALCQKCHNSYDAKHRVETRSKK